MKSVALNSVGLGSYDGMNETQRPQSERRLNRSQRYAMLCMLLAAVLN